MSFARVIEFSFSFLVAFVVLTVVSFLTLRPTLDQALMESRADWSALLRAVAERNDALPGLAEGLRGFEPGHGKLAEKILEARSIAVRSTDPETLVVAVNDTDKLLTQVLRLVQAKPNLEQYPPFATQWRKVTALTQRINYLRRTYSSSVRSYNRLLTAFPQKMVATLFGFAPLNEYATLVDTGFP